MNVANSCSIQLIDDIRELLLYVCVWFIFDFLIQDFTCLLTELRSCKFGKRGQNYF